MSNRGLWLEGGTTFPNRASRLLAVCLAVAWFVFIAARSVLQPLSTGQHECGTHPWDFLRIGEILEPRSLAFLVTAHCSDAKYAPGWIELNYRGGRVDVELRQVDIARANYIQIVSIGGLGLQEVSPAP